MVAIVVERPTLSHLPMCPDKKKTVSRYFIRHTGRVPTVEVSTARVP